GHGTERTFVEGRVFESRVPGGTWFTEKHFPPASCGIRTGCGWTTEQSADVHLAILQPTHAEITVGRQVHLEVSFERHVSRVNLEPEPAPAVGDGSQLAAGGSNQAFRILSARPAFGRAQIAAQPAELIRKQRIESKTRNGKRGLGHLANLRTSAGRKERDGAGECCAGGEDLVAQPEAFKRSLAAAADEFSADAVARVGSGLPNDHGNV